jgi:hypothetical protein
MSQGFGCMPWIRWESIACKAFATRSGCGAPSSARSVSLNRCGQRRERRNQAKFHVRIPILGTFRIARYEDREAIPAVAGHWPRLVFAKTPSSRGADC